jgi:CheY-like chemotaxis protein
MMTDVGMPVVVVCEPDLFLAVRIGDVSRATGAQAVFVADSQALEAAIAAWPVLVLIDVSAAAGWHEVVRRAKTQPENRAVPIIAFGSHVDTAALQAARTAGCDHAWARSRFMAELPALVQAAVQPPARPVAGCDEPPPPLLVQGVAQFNAGAYWECHETLETLWRQEARPVRDLYQGILQIGVGFHHARQGNQPGAIKVLRRGLMHLRELPEVCQGIGVAELRRDARAMHDRIVASGPAGCTWCDLEPLPRVVSE